MSLRAAKGGVAISGNCHYGTISDGFVCSANGIRIATGFALAMTILTICTAPSILFVGNGYIRSETPGGRSCWQSSSVRQFHSLRGPTSFACPKEVGKKTTHRGGAKTLLPQRHAPSPMYPSRTARLFLPIWVALPTEVLFGRGNGRGAPCPTARPDWLSILGGGGSIRGRAAL